MRSKGRASSSQGRGALREASRVPFQGPGPTLFDDDSDPARAVVTPPHLPVKAGSFYARMQGALRADQYGRPDGRPAGFCMHFYARCLCSPYLLNPSKPDMATTRGI